MKYHDAGIDLTNQYRLSKIPSRIYFELILDPNAHTNRRQIKSRVVNEKIHTNKQ